MRSASDDRTAIARIRDAAIDQWGQRGFNVGLRSIAEAAGGSNDDMVFSLAIVNSSEVRALASNFGDWSDFRNYGDE